MHSGAVKEDGRGVSIWDKFTHTKGKVERNENADMTCDHYNRCVGVGRACVCVCTRE
jgi:beta-glucosidase/6-phospho-beta-glucosidase/beta-galactosidase